MTDDYVRLKIKDALATVNNDRHDAAKLLITWAVRDQALLLGITKSHLKAITLALVEHTLRDKKSSKASAGDASLSKNTLDDLIATGRAPKDKRTPKNLPPPKSTERQASAMRKLAAAFVKKK